MADELDDLYELMIGQTYEVPLEFLDSSGDPIKLYGSSLYFLLKESPRNADADAALSVTIVLPNDQESSQGNCTLVVDSDDWSGVAAGQYYWSLVRVVTGDSPPSVYPHSSGKVNVNLAPLSTYA